MKQQAGLPRREASHDDPDSLSRLLGNRSSAIDASVPPVVFGLGWFVAGESIAVGSIAAMAVGAVIGGWRLWRGARPLAVLVSLLAVLFGAIIAMRTGQAVDFFLVRVISNAASALAFVISIVVRWPLLGVIVGTLLGQGKRWRRDPQLRRAYAWASLVWVGQYAVRLLVFIPLWAAGAVVPLAVAQAVLTWPLVAACVFVSWMVLRTALPEEHPGLRHPRVPGEQSAAE